MLNWRDAWHPKAGGAELVTLRVLERLVRRGITVEWFSGAYAGAGANPVGVSVGRNARCWTSSAG